MIYFGDQTENSQPLLFFPLYAWTAASSAVVPVQMSTLITPLFTMASEMRQELITYHKARIIEPMF
jgi:hypothetical protein